MEGGPERDSLSQATVPQVFRVLFTVTIGVEGTNPKLPLLGVEGTDRRGPGDSVGGGDRAESRTDPERIGIGQGGLGRNCLELEDPSMSSPPAWCRYGF